MPDLPTPKPSFPRLPPDLLDSLKGQGLATFPSAPSLAPIFQPPPPDPNFASEFHKRLTEMIDKFDAGLDQTQEVGVRLVSFGQTVTFHLKGIGYYNPSLITFSGVTVDGNDVELIQHISQISILLTTLPRQDPTKPKVRFGFHAGTQSGTDESNV